MPMIQFIRRCRLQRLLKLFFFVGVHYSYYCVEIFLSDIVGSNVWYPAEKGLSPVRFENYQPSYVKKTKTDAKQTLNDIWTESYLCWKVIRPFWVLVVNYVIFLNERHSRSCRTRQKMTKISTCRQARNVFLFTLTHVHWMSSTESQYIC